MAEFGQHADLNKTGSHNTSMKPAPKKIIICCDGTWQSSVTNSTNIPSNVTRLARYLTKAGKDETGKEWQQLVFYDAGIGTGVGEIEQKFQGGTGTGFIGNVIEAYNFIALNYNPGDQIFCLGFSRGAYTARTVAGVVTDLGIISPRDMQDFPELYHKYQAATDSHTFRKSAAWREWVEGKRLFDPSHKNVPKEWRNTPYAWEKKPHGAPAESTRWVEAVGVFDTVGSLGIPQIDGLLGKVVSFLGTALPVETFGFHNVALSPYIKNAYHAMALDERRKPFDTTLWHFPADGVAGVVKPAAPSSELRKRFRDFQSNNASEKELSKTWGDLIDAEMYEELKGSDSKLLQVWFPGVHINIGGGSNDLLAERKSDFEQISMLTFTWMVEQLKKHLSFEINVNQTSSLDRFLLMREAVDDLIANDQTDHWLIKKIDAVIAKDAKDPWNDGNLTRKKFLAADALKGWATGPIIDSFSGAMTKAGQQYRRPGGYKESKLQDGTVVRLGKSNEQIHPTVKFRMDQVADYMPEALRGFQRQPVKSGTQGVSYEWVNGDIRIPEYVLKVDSNERSYVSSSIAKEYLGKLDKEYGIDSFEARALSALTANRVIPQNQGSQPEAN